MSLHFVSVQVHVSEGTKMLAVASDRANFVVIRTERGDVTIAAESASVLHDFLTAAALKLEQAAVAFPQADPITSHQALSAESLRAAVDDTVEGIATGALSARAVTNAIMQRADEARHEADSVFTESAGAELRRKEGILANAERAGHGLTQRAVDAGMNQEYLKIHAEGSHLRIHAPLPEAASLAMDYMDEIAPKIDVLADAMERSFGRPPTYRELMIEVRRTGLLS